MNLSGTQLCLWSAGVNICVSVCHKQTETVDTFDPSDSHITGTSNRLRGVQLE